MHRYRPMRTVIAEEGRRAIHNREPEGCTFMRSPASHTPRWEDRLRRFRRVAHIFMGMTLWKKTRLVETFADRGIDKSHRAVHLHLSCWSSVQQIPSSSTGGLGPSAQKRSAPEPVHSHSLRYCTPRWGALQAVDPPAVRPPAEPAS